MLTYIDGNAARDDIRSRGVPIGHNALKDHRARKTGPQWTVINGQHLLRSALKDEVRRVASSMAWPEFGPDVAARTKEKGQLDRQIQNLQTGIEEVRTAADQAGVSL